MYPFLQIQVGNSEGRHISHSKEIRQRCPTQAACLHLHLLLIGTPPPPPPSPLFPPRQQSNRTQPTGLVPFSPPPSTLCGTLAAARVRILASAAAALPRLKLSKKRRLCSKSCYCLVWFRWERSTIAVGVASCLCRKGFSFGFALSEKLMMMWWWAMVVQVGELLEEGGIARLGSSALLSFYFLFFFLFVPRFLASLCGLSCWFSFYFKV